MKVLALNRNYQPVSIISARKAISKVSTGRAEMLFINGGSYETYNLETWFQERKELPVLIRFTEYNKLHRQKIRFSRKNLFIRDNYTCQYCGKHEKYDRLEVEHIIPRAQGGGTIWTNLTTACKRCNTVKGNRTPEQAEMPLLSNPFVPKFLHHNLSYLKDEKYKIWETFL